MCHAKYAGKQWVACAQQQHQQIARMRQVAAVACNNNSKLINLNGR